MIVRDERVPQFVADRTGVPFFPPMEFMGWERDGEITVGVILNCYTGPSIELTVAGGPWSRELLKALGEMVFGDLGCSRMGFTTESDEVAHMAQRCGGQIEGIARDFYGKGRDGVILGVLAEDWRFR